MPHFPSAPCASLRCLFACAIQVARRAHLAGFTVREWDESVDRQLHQAEPSWLRCVLNEIRVERVRRVVSEPF